MHKVKRAAHRAGWYSEREEQNAGWGRNWITGRYQARLPSDEENRLYQTQTESASSPIEDRRRAENDRDNAQFAGPIKSGTFAGREPQDRDFSSSASDKPYSEPSEKPSEETSKASNSRDLSAINTDSGITNGQPRKRTLKDKILHPGKKDEHKDVARTDTSESKKSRRPKLTFMSQVKAVFGSWINLLLIFVPVGIGLEYSGVNKIVVFIVNFIAIIPLAAVLSYSTEELALYIGEVLGGLLNATFGNAVELIVSIIALIQGKVLIVQTSLIGSMLSNLLLVMGMCFFFGGLNRLEQHFNVTVAQTAASLLALAIGSLIIPTSFRIFSDVDSGVTPASRGTAVLLLVTYACYLFFQLKTHTDMYNEPSEKVPKRSSGKKDAGEASKGIATIGASSAATAGGGINRENNVHEEDEEEDQPSLTRIGAIVTLAISTVFIALCAEYMVSAINEVTQGGKVSEEFIGLILLPIVGNAAEHVTAVTVAIKDKMDLSIGVAVGSSLQIALLVIPVMVLLNWFGVGAHAGGIQPPNENVLDLNFDGFLVVILVIAIWLVNYLIADGKSHWLEGALLMVLYLIIAVTSWFYPAKGDVAG